MVRSLIAAALAAVAVRKVRHHGRVSRAAEPVVDAIPVAIPIVHAKPVEPIGESNRLYAEIKNAESLSDAERVRRYGTEGLDLLRAALDALDDAIVVDAQSAEQSTVVDRWLKGEMSTDELEAEIAPDKVEDELHGWYAEDFQLGGFADSVQVCREDHGSGRHLSHGWFVFGGGEIVFPLNFN